jgi:hypothetical protein
MIRCGYCGAVNALPITDKPCAGCGAGKGGLEVESIEMATLRRISSAIERLCDLTERLCNATGQR